MFDVGTQIEKINSQPGHFHKDGARGRIVEIVRATGKYRGAANAVVEDGYLVRWDGEPEQFAPIFIPTHMVRKV